MSNVVTTNAGQHVVNVLGDFLFDLYERWQDEKEYEDIADYGKAIAKSLPAGFEFVAISKRPWGFTFRKDASTWQIAVTSRSIKFRKVN